MKKLLTLTFLAASLAVAQTPSGLLTGPVTYTSNLVSGNLYGNYLFHKADGTVCSLVAPTPTPSNWSQCFMVRSVDNQYGNLQASDGTSAGIPNCYTWDYWQLIMNDQGYCQSSFYGGGSGEQRVAIYCPTSTSSDINGTYTSNGIGCTFGGTAITVIGGADIPISTQFTVTVKIQHVPTVVILPVYRSHPQPQLWQQVTAMSVVVTPVPGT